LDIITPISPEYKKLLKDNPELSGLKEFFADYISTILSEKSEDNPNKKFVEKQDLESFEWYLENILEYKKILEDEWIEINNLWLIEKLIIWQSIESFKEILKNKNLLKLLREWKEINLLNLLLLKQFWIKELIKISRFSNLIELIAVWDEETFLLLLKLKTFNVNKLIELSFSLDSVNLLNDDSKTVISSLLKFKDITVNDLIKVFLDLRLSSFIFYWNKVIFKIFIKLFNITNIKDLIKITNNSELYSILKDWKENNFSKILELYNIKNKEDFKKLQENNKYTHLKTLIFKYDNVINDFKTIEYIKNITPTTKNTYDINFENTYIWVWACSKNEYYNNNILVTKEYKKVLICYINSDVIWVIKKEWEKSFLAFKDVFDKEWNLIFLKWFIYNFMINWNKLEETNQMYDEKINLNNSDLNIKIKPIRKIKEFHNIDLYLNFDKIIASFIDDII